MKTSKYILLIPVLIFTFTSKLYAFTQEGCVRFPYQHTDGRVDDEALPCVSSDGFDCDEIYTVVPGLRYEVTDMTDVADGDYDDPGEPVSGGSGFLDVQGCVQPFSVVAGRKYRLRVYHDYEDLQGRGFVISNNSTSSTVDNFIPASSVYNWWAAATDGQFQNDFGSNDRSKLVSTLYEIYSREWVPSNHKVRVVSNHPAYSLCYNNGTMYEAIYHHTMTSPQGEVPSETLCLDADNGTKKYVMAHESGHGISMTLNGFDKISYAADMPGVASPVLSRFRQNQECYPYDDELQAGQDHYMNSREFSGTAAFEGIAHAISVGTWRDFENPDAAVFVYQDGDYFPGRDLNGNYERVTDSNCRPPSHRYQKLGSERDWMSFFWGLWTENDELNQFSFTEMMSIWSTLRPGDDEGEKSWCRYIYRYPSTAPESLLDALPLEKQEGWVCKDEAFVAPAVFYNFAQPPHGHEPFWYVAGVANIADATAYLAGFTRNELIDGVTADKRDFFENLGRDAGIFYDYQ